MTAGKARKAKVKLQVPARMVPVHIQGRPPPFFILGGLVFTQVGLSVKHNVVPQPWEHWQELAGATPLNPSSICVSMLGRKCMPDCSTPICQLPATV